MAMNMGRGKAVVVALAAVLVVLVAGVGAASSPPSSSDCTAAYQTLVPCYTYLTTPGSALPSTCCTGLSSLNADNPTCLCQLITQINGSSASVNATKAYALPTDCKIALKTDSCPALANLPVTAPSGTPSSTPAAAGPKEASGPGSSPGTGTPGSSGASSFMPSHGMMGVAAVAIIGVEAIVHFL